MATTVQVINKCSSVHLGFLVGSYSSELPFHTELLTFGQNCTSEAALLARAVLYPNIAAPTKPHENTDLITTESISLIQLPCSAASINRLVTQLDRFNSIEF